MLDAIVIIQARMGSKRFPGKMLADLCGKPVIQHVIDNVLKSEPAGLSVAIPDTAENDPLAKYLSDQRVLWYRGHESDVLKRFFDAATQFVNRDNTFLPFVRITGDCPLVDHHLINYMVEKYYDSEHDYVGRTNDPDGTDVEVFGYDSLVLADQYAQSQYDREHVTPWIRNNRKALIEHGHCSTKNIKFSIDTPEDLAECEALLKTCGAGCRWRTYVEALKAQ